MIAQSNVAPVPVIAVDGPSGAGKGTICAIIAKRLGFHLLDSGAVYRAIACWALKQKLNEQQALIKLADPRVAPKLAMQVDETDKRVRVIVDGQDVTCMLRSEDCGAMASHLAQHSIVRSKVMRLQRSCVRHPGLVADGRDMGSVVFPDAKLKIFLTADPKVRAKRRFEQLQSMHLNVSLRKVCEDMRQRDELDRARKIAPLIPDPAAVILDTTKLSIEETAEQVLALAKQAGMGNCC